MATTKKTKTKSSFKKIFLTILIVILVMGTAITVFKQTKAAPQTASDNNSPAISHKQNNLSITIAPTLASWNVTTIGWKTYTLPNEKLTFKYPETWSVVQIPGQTQDYDSIEVHSGRYEIIFEVYKSNSYEAQPGNSMDGSSYYWVPIDSFILNNQTVYLLNEGSDGSKGSDGMTLSSCANKTKCLVKAKNVPGYIDIESSYIEGTTGDFAPGTIKANDPNLGIIKAIIKSISYH